MDYNSLDGLQVTKNHQGKINVRVAKKWKEIHYRSGRVDGVNLIFIDNSVSHLSKILFRFISNKYYYENIIKPELMLKFDWLHTVQTNALLGEIFTH